MRLFTKILSLALVAAGFAGCLKDNAGPALSGKPSGVMTIRVNVPGMATPSTRAFDETQEKQVNALDVLVFRNSDNRLVQCVPIASADIVSGGDGWVFKIKDPALTGNITVAVAANAPDEVGQMLSITGFSEAGQIYPAKTAVLEALQYAFAGTKWVTSGAGAMYLPMYGEVSVPGSVYASASQSIDLKRMVARIDVMNAVAPDGTAVAGNFKLTAVHLVNYNQAGYIAPKWDASTGALVTEDPQMPNAGGTIDLNKKTWTQDGDQQIYTVGEPVGGTQSITGEIYTFESWAAYSDSQDPGAANPAAPATATRLVLQGEYTDADGTRTYWYPVDFVYPHDDAAETTKYMPLLRNHRYVVSIDAAGGGGYGSIGEAVAAYSTLSNLKTRIIAYNEGDLRYIAFDGQYMIGVGKKEVAISKEAQTVALALFTDNPAGWNAAIRCDAADGNWLTFPGASGASSAGGATLGLLASANPGPGSRTATVTLTAGRNRTVAVTVTQSNVSRHYIRITDGQGNEIDRLMFDYGIGQPGIPSQEFYVTWNLPSQPCAISSAPTAGANGAFTYAAGSDTPGVAPTTSISGGARMFSVTTNPAGQSDLDADPFFVNSSTLTFTVGDGLGNTFAKTLELRQGGYNFIADVSNPYLFGRTHSFNIRCNTTWEVTAYSDPFGILAEPDALIGRTGGNNTAGEPFQFTMAARDETKRGRQATITFHDPEGKIADQTVTIIAISGYLPASGTLAPPGVLGVGATTGKLTLRGSMEYAGTPVAAASEFGPLADERVYIVYFKWNSLVAHAGGGYGDVFDVTDITWAPLGYDLSALMRSIGSQTGQAAWNLVPGSTVAWQTNVPAGYGDPCPYADKGTSTYNYITPPTYDYYGMQLWNGVYYNRNNMVWTTVNASGIDVSGRYPISPVNWSMFSPAAGYRGTNGTFLYAGTHGSYWSTARYSQIDIITLYFSNDSNWDIVYSGWVLNGLNGSSVRCVRR